MTAEIYYFTGTGNSLVVARDLSEMIHAKLIPAASLVDRKSVTSDADVLGFVFPIYDFKPPGLITESVRKFEGLDSKYIFAVCTYGIAPLNVMKFFDQLIRSNGGELSSGFAVKMPHNGLGSGSSSKARQEQLFMDWKTKRDEIGDCVISSSKGELESSNKLALCGQFVRKVPFLLRLLKQVIPKGWDSLAMISNDKCDGCGICERVCPVGNIEIVDKKPSWSDHSEGCFACFHWCPKKAIQLGHSNIDVEQYHHPEVRMIDIIGQREIHVQ